MSFVLDLQGEYHDKRFIEQREIQHKTGTKPRGRLMGPLEHGPGRTRQRSTMSREKGHSGNHEMD